MNRVLTAVVLVMTVSSVGAQTAEDPAHQALRNLKTTMEKALNERNLDAIVANVDPNVVFTTMNGDVCRGPEQIRAYFHKMLNAPGHIVKDVKVSFEVDALTTLYGGDTGVAYGSSRDHYELTDGGTFDINGRWTATMVRSGDRWVIAAFHYSANVFENPITARLKQAIWQVGIGAGLLGLLIGYFGARFLTRRGATAV
jgi:uncharacterized protein (TIGR02246 family)